VLHSLLNHPPLQPFILGGKGVGSQGYGTAQFLVSDRDRQGRVIDIIHRDFPQNQCLKLIISQSKPAYLDVHHLKTCYNYRRIYFSSVQTR
jgi:galactokinase